MVSLVSQIFNNFNWGQKYERLLEAAELLQNSFANPNKFSETRFVNSKWFVLINFLKDLQAIVMCLKSTIKENENGNSEQRKKASEAKEW